MTHDTTTLSGRVRYVMHHDPMARESYAVCYRGVWRTFYAHLFFDDPMRGRCISEIDVQHLPTIAAVRKEWRRVLGIERRQAKTPASIPYYVEMS